MQVDRLGFCKKGLMSVTGPSPDDQLDLRFCRCRYFILADSESDSFESIGNEAAASMGGAGLQAAQTLMDAGVKAEITGNIRSNAISELTFPIVFLQ